MITQRNTMPKLGIQYLVKLSFSLTLAKHRCRQEKLLNDKFFIELIPLKYINEYTSVGKGSAQLCNVLYTKNYPAGQECSLISDFIMFSIINLECHFQSAIT